MASTSQTGALATSMNGTLGMSSTGALPASGARLVVLVRNGRMKGQKAILPPGGALRVGRSEQADLVFPGDVQMSAVHCELAWDGRACTLRDLGSIKGTKLGGEPVTEALVEDGNYLQAGDTVLSVYVEGAIPPRKRHKPSPEVQALREKALSSLRATADSLPGHALFAVLDAARDDRILELLPRSGEDFESLYDGARGEALAEVAPYLARLSPGSRLLESLVMEGWGDAWGIYLTWPGPMKELRRHLRRFLMVIDDETTQKMYFRYYDPRALRLIWPAFSRMQVDEMLGEIGCLVVEGETGEVLRLAGGGA